MSYFISNGVWNISLLQQTVPIEFVHKIMVVPLPLAPKPDHLIWGPSPSGYFTISSDSWLSQSSKPPHSNASFLHKIWKLKLPPKVKIFSWILFRNRLKTRDTLSRYNLNILAYCPLRRQCWPRPCCCPLRTLRLCALGIKGSAI